MRKNPYTQVPVPPMFLNNWGKLDLALAEHMLKPAPVYNPGVPGVPLQGQPLAAPKPEYYQPNLYSATPAGEHEDGRE